MTLFFFFFRYKFLAFLSICSIYSFSFACRIHTHMIQQEKMNRFTGALYRFWDTRIHFLELHYIYILFLMFFFSGLYYCEPGTDWNYIDALFMATTGSTDTGLNTIAMSAMSTYHMVLLYISSFLGSHVTVSFVVVMVRRYYFSKRFEKELEYNKKRKEEYRQQKLLREQQAQEQEEQQQRLSSDASSTTTKASRKTEIITGPIRRRMSMLSVRSTPAHHSRKLSFFHLKKRGSYDTHATRTRDIVVHHPNYNYNDSSNGSTSPSDTNFSSIQMDHYPYSEDQQQQQQQEQDDNDNDESDNDSDHVECIASTHPCDTTPCNSKRNSNVSSDDNSSHQHEKTAPSFSDDKPVNNTSNATNNNNQQITFREDTNVLRERERRKLLQNRNEDNNLEQLPLHRTNSEYEIMRQPSAKHELTKNERYRIGGTEYRALEMLARIVPLYYLGFIISFGFFFRIYVAASTYAQEVLATSNPTGPVEPWFFSFFMSLSAFTNLGLNHLDASMAPFQNAPAPLILAILLILVGNTAFAILLRFIIWICYVLTPERKVMRRETFRYLLDHPRRCYTTLFPSTQTWWLLIVLIAITLVELICFLALNYWLPVLAGISWGSRFLDGLFQSVATRNAGFSVVSLADLNPGAQLVYIIAMYISVYPVAISMRNSNIYQERALGIFRGEDEEPVKFSDDDLAEAPFIKLKRHSTMTSIAQGTKKLLKGPDFFVITQIQRQLTSDICWVITGIFCICVIEAESIMSPSPVTIATVIYECVSAFGNVGASTGYPNTATSQAAQYRTLSKLVLIILMYRGRHRGLPASIDRSILLPSDALAEKEKEDEIRRRNTSVSLQVVNDSATSSGVQGSPDHLIYTRSCTL
ncbi:cation transport protein-domain-containing protein [Mucor lusitanicus]|uniref:Potassium transport protein n=1 Tax=Mucor circinelloides f. lusitanicus TaxID=29924 RepID=A0A8H4BSS4_MUCCL|nr:cation transport protein-domain-containing protein [Mucor lusitanicus]